MRIVTKEFLNDNSYLSYPIDFRATYEPYSKEDASAINSLLLDMKLTLPENVATTAFIASLKVTNALVSLIIMGSKDTPYYDDPPTTPSYSSAEYDAFSAVVLATATVAKAVALRQTPVKLEGVIDGVGGWVVFGPGVQNNASWSFSGPASSAISSSALCKYKYEGVKSIAKAGFEQSIDGAVTFIGQNGIEVVKEGNNVVSIKFSGTADEIKNSLSNYKGECGIRPETDTCLLTPIKNINKVKPKKSTQGLNEIVVIIDSPLYAELIDVSNYDGSVIDKGGFAISSDVALESLCPPRLTIPDIESCKDPATPDAAQITSPTITFGSEILLEATSASSSDSYIFVMSQQHPTRKNVSVLKPLIRSVELLGETLYELHVDHSNMQWQAYTGNGPSLKLFGPVGVNLNGSRTITINGVETRVAIGRLNVLDRLNLNSVKISVDSSEIPDWTGTYTRSFIGVYSHSQNSDYSLQVSPFNNSWIIRFKGAVVAGGSFDSSGIGITVQNYKTDDGVSKVRSVTAAGVA